MRKLFLDIETVPATPEAKAPPPVPTLTAQTPIPASGKFWGT